MSDDSNIESKVLSIIADQLDIDKSSIELDSSFIDDLGADSLDSVELVMALETEFEIDIPDEDADKIKTVRQAIDKIKANISVEKAK